MPAPLVDVVAVLALAVVLATAFAHPRARVELAVGLGAAGAVLAVGAVSWDAAVDEVRLLAPVVAFLAAILVVAQLCQDTGVFVSVGALLARAASAPRRFLALTFAAAASTTAALSLDATVVLLTPVVVAVAASGGVSSRPGTFACVRLANSASVLLPVSNLTNLLALPSLPGLSFTGFALVMAPVWCVVVAVEYAAHRVFFRADLAAGDAPDAPPAEPLPRVPLVVVASMLVGFAVLSPLGVEPAWVAGAAAAVLSAYALARRRTSAPSVAHAAHLPFCGFVLCLGVVVAGVAETFLADATRTVLPTSTGLGGLLLVALVATALANLLNNLPATLLLVPLVAPLGTTAVLAALIGLGVGSGLTMPGSLANLLWRRTMRRAGSPVSLRDFHLLALLATPPAVVVGVVVLWAWAPLVT